MQQQRGTDDGNAEPTSADSDAHAASNDQPHFAALSLRCRCPLALQTIHALALSLRSTVSAVSAFLLLQLEVEY